MSKFMNLTGLKFGRLSVIEYAGKDRNNISTWICNCDCGTDNILVTVSNLRNGSVSSCGCYKKEIVTEKNKKENRYIFEKDIVRVLTSKNEEFIIDKDDYEKIKDHTWSLDGNGYARTGFDNSQIKLHRYVTDAPDDMEIDHKDGNILNNRKSNLRICTRQENAMNLKLSKNNTSGHKGVYFDKTCNQWFSVINYKKTRINLGFYKSQIDAIKARQDAEKYYFGEFRREIIYDNT